MSTISVVRHKWRWKRWLLDSIWIILLASEQETWKCIRIKSWNLTQTEGFSVCPSGCDDHCMVCEGPGRCQQCQPPYTVLLGQCVRRCGRNFFLDAASQHCKRKSWLRKCSCQVSEHYWRCWFSLSRIDCSRFVWLSVIQAAAVMKPKMSARRGAVVIVSGDGRSGQAPVIAVAPLPNIFLPVLMNSDSWCCSVEDVCEFLMKQTANIILAQANVWLSVNLLWLSTWGRLGPIKTGKSYFVFLV